MSMIRAANLTFAYEGSYDTIFENVSFEMDTDWKLGFTGRNGRGKTTFLKLLMGEYEYEGSISAPVSFDYFPFEVWDRERNTKEVAAEVSPDYEEWRLLRELSLLEMDEEALYRPFSSLSSGEQTKLLLALLFIKESNFLLIDEPTNHLDARGRKLVSRYLSKKKGFILVSHDRVFLDGCIDHILAINKNNIEIQKGNFSSWQQNKAYRDAFELAENDKLKKEICRLSEAAGRNSKWSDDIEKTKNGTKVSGVKPDKGHIGAQAAKMMKRAKSAEDRIARSLDVKEQLLKNIETADDLSVRPLNYHASRLAEFLEVKASYGENQVLQGITFSVNQGERIALTGKNGSGKSTLLKLLAAFSGVAEPLEGLSHTGTVTVGSRLIVSYVPQDSSFLKGDLKTFAGDCGIDERIFKALLRKLDFPRIQFEKDMCDFSAGQKKKVLIAKSLCEKAHLYLWDEPLNYMDVLSRMQIENLVLKSGMTMVFVEHDLAFADRVGTKRIDL